jgi:hypothetical protein
VRLCDERFGLLLAGAGKLAIQRPVDKEAAVLKSRAIALHPPDQLFAHAKHVAAEYAARRTLLPGHKRLE